MLVICEDCAKKYSIDEKRIKAPKVKFNCRACGHIIIVEKPQKSHHSTEKLHSEDLSASSVFSEQGQTDHEKKESTDKEQTKEIVNKRPAETPASVRAALRNSATATGKGVPFFVYFLAVILFGLLAISTIFIHFYLNAVPELLHQQLELRSRALTESLKGTISAPLARKDYLTVNQEVKRTSKLPGVAYAAIRNKKGIIIAGFLGNPNKFENHFSQKVKEKGFQSDVLVKNTIPPGKKERGAEIRVGGIPIYDQVIALQEIDGPEIVGELHVGLYVDELGKHLFSALFSPLTLSFLFLFLLSGYVLFVLLDKLITNPMRNLTNVANRISLGELDLAIMASGPREIRELGAALERMRHSIKVAMERLSR